MFSLYEQVLRAGEISRRQFLSAGAIGGGLTLSRLLQAEQAVGIGKSYKAVINIHLDGGPPQMDMIDLKPQAPVEIRGEFNPIDNLAPLAKARVKIMHLHGDQDTLIPTGANATELARRYRDLGGEAEIILLKDLPASKRGHDGPELYESASLLKFLLAD